MGAMAVDHLFTADDLYVFFQPESKERRQELSIVTF
jgi:hypothetical protein